jgi:cysteine desulfuration protein SufE
MTAQLPPRLSEIVDEFKLCEGREKLELLIEYAQSLPALPDWLAAQHGKMEPVQECMTPVHIHVERTDGGMVFHFDVPAESPTVRGYAAIMKQGLDGESPEIVLQIPADFFYEMGLQSVVNYQRLNGMSAILATMKQLALRTLE